MLEGKSRGIKNVTLVSAGKMRFARCLNYGKSVPNKAKFQGFHAWKSFKISKPSPINKETRHPKSGRPDPKNREKTQKSSSTTFPLLVVSWLQALCFVPGARPSDFLGRPPWMMS
jgi:hypothetical protein